ncbi:HAD hydrolase-like protein [Streptomyces shenzhenensis]|uniref:HAD hydrolase-like protein n=1 Tax=Streptomyces shenzhenensis TaxID=943815 RepID=UPI0033DFEAF1
MRAPLFVGDRLDTDIRGARAAGLRSAVVLTGVSTPADIVAAGASSRPDYLLEYLRGLLHPYPATRLLPDGTVAVGAAAVGVEHDAVRVVRAGSCRIGRVGAP